MRTSQRSQLQILSTLLIFISVPFAMLHSQAVPSSMVELANASDAVIVGKVSGLSSEWNETKTRIQTRVTILVDQNVKGDASVKEMTVIVPGGEVDGVGEVYSHSPKFLRDEAVVVFAKKNIVGTYRVSNGSQGKYTIQKDELSGALMVSGQKTLEEFTSTVKTALQIQIMK